MAVLALLTWQQLTTSDGETYLLMPTRHTSPTSTVTATITAATSTVPNHIAVSCNKASYGLGVSNTLSTQAASLALARQQFDQYVDTAVDDQCRLTGYKISQTTALTAMSESNNYYFQVTFTVNTPSTPTTFWIAGNGEISGNSVTNKVLFYQVVNRNNLYVITAAGTSPPF